MASTLSASQIYGTYTKVLDLEAKPGESELASGNPQKGVKGKTPALVYVVLIILLVLVRILYENAS